MTNATDWVMQVYSHPCTPLGPYASVLSCLERGLLYTAHHLVPSALLGVSQMAFNSALWATRTFLQAPDWMLNKAIFHVTGQFSSISLYNSTVAHLAEPLTHAISRADALATQILLPHSIISPLSKTATKIGAGSFFKASDLIPPLLIWGVSTYKSLANAPAAVKKIKQLVTGQRITTTYSLIFPDVSTEGARHPIPLIMQKMYTSWELAIDSVFNSLWTAGWGSVSYCMSQKMIDILIAAGNDLSTSQMKVLALGTAVLVAPYFVKLVHQISRKAGHVDFPVSLRASNFSSSGQAKLRQIVNKVIGGSAGFSMKKWVTARCSTFGRG